MKLARLYWVLFAAFVAVAPRTAALAEIIGKLTLDDSTITISADETAIVHATLHLADNSDPLVTDSLDELIEFAQPVGRFYLSHILLVGPNSAPPIPVGFVDYGAFASSFADISIMPGQDFDFALALLVPTSALSPGTYSFGPSIGFFNICGGEGLCNLHDDPWFLVPEQRETVIVAAAVPEPGSVISFAGGLIWLLGWTRRV